MTSNRDELSGPWAISVRTATKTILKIIPREPDEDLRDCLLRTKDTAKAIREKYKTRTDLVVEVISRSMAFPKPDKVRLGRGELWCPYCCKSRKFRKGELMKFDGIEFISDEPRCLICGMSTRDYYVIDFNGLWPRELTNIKAKKGK